MRMDRNINADGHGKYAIVNLRKLRALESAPQADASMAIRDLARLGVLEWGSVGATDEFFLVKLRDRHAQDALLAYAKAAHRYDPEWSAEVYELALRAGPAHPLCKAPD